MTRLLDYEKTVGAATWAAINKYADDLKKRRIKIAFFSATPQGGGVALMRHAMVRFAKELGVDIRWYGLPSPNNSIKSYLRFLTIIYLGMSRSRGMVSSESLRTTIIFCKASHRPALDSLWKIGISSVIGSLRMHNATGPREQSL